MLIVGYFVICVCVDVIVVLWFGLCAINLLSLCCFGVRCCYLFDLRLRRVVYYVLGFALLMVV